MPKDETKHYKSATSSSAPPRDPIASTNTGGTSSNDGGNGNAKDDSKDKPKKVLRACDACHHRRVRCNHANPCDNCIRLNINCTWIKASKGKQASGRRIDLLRKGHNPAAADAEASSARNATASLPSLANPHPPPPPLPAHSPSTSRMILPPPSPRRPSHPMSALSPSAQPPNAPSPGSMNPPSLYSREARGSFSSYGRHDAALSAGSPSSYWPSPSARSPSGRYSLSSTPSHPSYAHNDYPPSSSSHQHHLTSPHHQQHPYPSPSHHAGQAASHHSYSHHHNPSPHHPQHPSPYPPVSTSHHNNNNGAGPSGMASRHNSSASISGPTSAPAGALVPAGAGAGLGFVSSSQTFTDGLGGSFSELAPDVAAGLRLPDFGTSLADSYLNPQESSERRRNMLLEMQASDAQGGSAGVQYGYSHDGSGRQTVLDVLGQSTQLFGPSSTPGSVSYSDSDHYGGQNEPHPLSDSVLIPSIALFFERLQSIMPVFTRAWVFGKIDRGEHRSDPQLGAMLIALSAFALTQPVESSDPLDSSSRKRRVRRLLEESVKMRDSALFGANPSLEAIMTSFFIFGTLFGLGEENAAWFRLREAVTLGYLLRIHETSSYEHLDKDEQERRLRAYLLLAITERAYAIQSGSSITFRGNPRKATDAIRRQFDVSQLQDFPNNQSRLFDVVDEKFVDCWNKKCPGVGCDYLDAKRAVQLHKAIKESDKEDHFDVQALAMDSGRGGGGNTQRRDGGPYDRRRSSSIHQHHPYAPGGSGGGGGHYSSSSSSSSTAAGMKPEDAHVSNGSGGGSGSGLVPPPGGGWDKKKVQKADVDVTRQWLLNRLWMICRSHGLLTADAPEPPLRIDYAIDIARETLRVCNSLSLRSMEAHGIGLTRKLNDIAQTLVIVCRDYPAIAMSVPFEGDPINTDPTLFGPYLGPSPQPHSSQQSPSTSIDSSSNAASATVPTLGMVPLDKAFSPSYAIEAILHKYLDLFKRFRNGDHPYLPELVEAVKELPKMAELSFDKFLRDMGLF